MLRILRVRLGSAPTLKISLLSSTHFIFTAIRLLHTVINQARPLISLTHCSRFWLQSDGCQHHRGGGGGSKVDTSDVAGRERKSPWPMISVEKAQGRERKGVG